MTKKKNSDILKKKKEKPEKEERDKEKDNRTEEILSPFT